MNWHALAERRHVSNLRYAVLDGAGSGTSSFNNNVWYNSEYNWSSLCILADFTDIRHQAVGF